MAWKSPEKWRYLLLWQAAWVGCVGLDTNSFAAPLTVGMIIYISIIDDCLALCLVMIYVGAPDPDSE